jgi:sugar phosphate isomerase/epimerase
MPVMKLAIVSDEISRDFDTAVEIGTGWGIRAYEVRNLGSGRVPAVQEWEVQRVVSLKQQLGLTITAVSPGLFKVPADAPDMERRLAEDLPRACDLARRLDASALVDFGFRKPGVSGGRLGDVPGKQYPRQVVDLLRRVAETTERHGCRFLLENEHICWADTGEATAMIARDVAHPNLRVNWDPTNASHFDEVVFPDGFNMVKDLVGHVHVKDFTHKDGAHVVVPPGEGRVNWPDQVRSLIALGYQGWLVVETHMWPRVENSRRCVAAVRQMLCDICGT